jgi:hypothetical protein
MDMVFPVAVAGGLALVLAVLILLTCDAVADVRDVIAARRRKGGQP